MPCHGSNGAQAHLAIHQRSKGDCLREHCLRFLPILLRPSIAKINKKGDNGSPCCTPLWPLKKPAREPFIRIEKYIVDVHYFIQLIHLCPKPILPNMSNKPPPPPNMIICLLNVQLAQIIGLFCLILKSTAWLSSWTTSTIHLPLMKAIYWVPPILTSPFLVFQSAPLKITCMHYLSSWYVWNLLIPLASSFWGIRAMEVALKSSFKRPAHENSKMPP